MLYKLSITIISVICSSALYQINAQSVKSLSGNFSSEGDITAKGIITMEVTQSGTKIEGISNYKTFDNQIDSGLLSVNGYAKNNIGYIRFRDQKGNLIADGTINYKNPETLYFRQITKSSSLPNSAYLYPQRIDPQKKITIIENYTGKYSNEGDIVANGIISYELPQTGKKIEGIANNKTFDNNLDSGLLSVNGYVKENIAYIRFRDQKGDIVAGGTLTQKSQNIIFKQTTSSNILPKKAILYR